VLATPAHRHAESFRLPKFSSDYSDDLDEISPSCFELGDAIKFGLLFGVVTVIGARLRYDEGYASYLEVIYAENLLYEAHVRRIQGQGRLFQAMANFYKAMGIGG
jgi:hypothetical protein